MIVDYPRSPNSKQGRKCTGGTFAVKTNAGQNNYPNKDGFIGKSMIRSHHVSLSNNIIPGISHL
eukprot:CAMPEP_0168164082 /NCGR_PEP_ID=MMETSP0139_2-20121125/738_1 /TAXON_ID=44445 /ORGANISM="Pseudo-nitzschia australis, Strain 10249 10 AB" /LENGTH=63 /DNA_ID=CAMNT_0008081057 /DNA_START=229 /DNA_END=420 /DNA_ORIENTATION=+